MRKRDTIFIKNLYLLLLTVLVLILITVLPLFYNFEKIALDIVFSDTITLLEQTGREASSLVDTGQKLTIQIHADNSIRYLMFRDPPSESEKVIGMEQLANYQNIMKFVDSIYIYNGKQHKIYVSNSKRLYHNLIVPECDFTDLGAMDIINNYNSYNAYYPIARYATMQSGSPKPYYSFFGYDFIDKDESGELFCAVMVNISPDWIENLIVNVGQNENLIPGETFIINRSGVVLSNSQNYPMMMSLSGETYIADVLGKEENGYIIADINGEKTFLAYTSPDKMGWQYLRIIPYRFIISEIVRMRNFSIILALAVFFTGALLVLLLNLVFYKPIEKIKVDLGVLQNRHRENFFDLKQDFLRRLLLDSQREMPQSTIDSFPDFGITLQPERDCYIAIIKIDNYSNFISQYTLEDRNTYKFAIMNIACELCSELFNAGAVDMHNNQLVVLLTRRDTAGQIAEHDFERIFSSVRREVQQHFSFSISCAVSRNGELMADIYPLYIQAVEAIRHRFFAGRGCILFAGRVVKNPGGDYEYPERKEKMLLDALTKLNLDKAKEIYLDILLESADYSFTIVNITVSRLALFINYVIKNIRSQKNIDSPDNIFYVNLSQIETIDELNSLFFTAMEDIVSQIEENSGGKTDQIINEINRIIQEKYRDQALCIESIADMLNLSASYTGRIYKHATCMTILEMISNVRMAKARELLTHTDETILTIAEMVGFSSDSYFYKTFKQENGLTPAAFRKKYRKKAVI